jgi:integrase
MSNPKKPARLCLRHRRGRESVWVVRNGKAETSTGCREGDLPKAEKFFAEWLEKHVRPNTRERNLANIFVQEVLNLYATDIAPLRASRSTIGFHIGNLQPFWGAKTLAEVRGHTCREYTRERQQAGRKSATARREMKTLQAAINHWHSESPLEAVPKVKLPPEGERRERVLERHEAASLLRSARQLGYTHLVRFILIGLYTGTRRNAILGLRWSPALSGGHIDLEQGIVYRRGAAEGETSKRRPPICIGPRLLGHLRRWKAMAEERSTHVITWNDARISSIKRAWANAARSAGLGPEVTPHVLRHTFVTWELRKGRSVWDVGNDAGADATTIQKVYGHHRLPSQVRKVA